MSMIRLALYVLFAGLYAGCGGSSSSAMGNDGGASGGGDDGDLPFTSGASTLAGAGDAGYVDGSRKVARFANPVNVAYRDGTLYVADFDNSKLRAIDTTSHVTTTVIDQKGFSRPFGLALGPGGALYVSTDNDQAGKHAPMSGTIWKVDATAHTATVVAGSIGRPRGMAVLPDGRIAVADYEHHVIELVDPATGKVVPIAGVWDGKGMADGAGAAARFSAPYSLVVRADGKLVVTDYDNNRLRLVALDGTTTTLAGAAEPAFVDGALAIARFNHPQGMSAAQNGDIYITDTGNYRVRRISGDMIQTVAGDGNAGWADNDNPLAAEFYGLEGLCVTPDGSMVYVADGDRGESMPYNRVRQVKLK